MSDLAVDFVRAAIVCKELLCRVFKHGFVFTEAKVFRLFCHVYLLLRLGHAQDTFAQDVALNFVSTGCNRNTE